MKCILRKLTVDDGIEIYNMLQQIPKDENGFVNNINGQSFVDYKKWLVKSDISSKKTEMEDGWKVPQSTYWLFADGKPIGMGKIRHFLTDKLIEEGGTLGYAIIPSERKKGYGTVLLNELLKEAQKLSIDKVLLTIRNDNVASIKVALANGGVIEKANDIRHFIWIDCNFAK